MGDHRLFAAVYDRMTAPMEAQGFGQTRKELLAQACGQVLEIGGGTGANVCHYPADRVDHVAVLEPDGAMRRRLVARLADAPVPVEVHEAGIHEGPFATPLPSLAGSFDTVVSTLVLCSVPDPAAALRSVRRLLKEDGRLLFAEHVLQPGLRGHVQKAVTPAWRRFAGGCHLDRDLVHEIRAAGFFVTDADRFAGPGKTLMGEIVVGVARPS